MTKQKLTCLVLAAVIGAGFSFGAQAQTLRDAMKERAAGAKDKGEAYCAENPEACSDARASGAARWSQAKESAKAKGEAHCAENPEDCQAKADAARMQAEAAKAKGEAYCAENPEACAEGRARMATHVDEVKSSVKAGCAENPEACEEKTEAFRDRLRARKDGADD